MGDPVTSEGKALMEWWEATDEPFVCDKFEFFDEIAAVVLDHPERDRLPAELELEERMIEALKKELGTMISAPDESWRTAARGMIARMGLTPARNSFDLRDDYFALKGRKK